MKHTLKDEIESLLKGLEDRCDMLNKHIEGYLADGNLNDAAINKIKHDQLKMVTNTLQSILKKH